MKYIIQVFRKSGKDANVGYWADTAWGSYDFTKAMETFEKVRKDAKFIYKVRLVEVLQEEKTRVTELEEEKDKAQTTI